MQGVKDRPRLSLIAAVAANGVIGSQNTLPWQLPEDLKYFRQRTLGHPIVMGRHTWDSLGRALPGRRNLVISRKPGFSAPGAETFQSLNDALIACDEEEIFIIGGGTLYEATLPIASRLYLTEIEAVFDGDTFFPPVDKALWKETSREPHTSASGLRFAFVTYTRAEI